MRRKISLSAVVGPFVIVLCLTLATRAHAASKEQVLYSFDEGNNGAYPVAGLVSDAKGNLYGTTELAGAGGGGIVYELSPASAGTSRFTLLHTFDVPSEGGDPQGGLTFDNEGNLFGTTSIGGSFDGGTVYQLTPDANGWKFAVIYAFRGGNNAGYPSGPLLFDGKNVLYGTAGGGNSNCTFRCGTVFQLRQASGGAWVEKVLHRFQGGSDGEGPVGGVIRDSAGTLYGTTTLGGINQCDAGCGTIFKLSLESKGWKRTTLYNFTGTSDGYSPAGGLVLDKGSDLFGVTSLGGDANCGCGTAFKLTKNGKHAVLHRFGKSASDGAFPMAGLVLGAAGVLYGTTSEGGRQGNQCGSAGCGLVFKLKGNNLTVLYNFDFEHGAMPEAPLLWDGAGHIFGTTFEGGTGFVGTAFELAL